METYGRIKKTKAVALPDDKSKLSTGNLILATLKRVAQETGINAEEMVYNTLSGIPEDVLSKEDRKARKRQFKKMLSEVSSTEPSPYDLSELLERKLFADEYP